MDKHSNVIENIKTYYGKTLQNKNDLKTSACCTDQNVPDHLKELMGNIHDDIVSKYYGCGSPIPPMLTGATVLDLGCGTGLDCYLASQLVGENGRVIGVDMTKEQISIAQNYEDYQKIKFGYKKKNTEFHHGYIEDLDSIGVADNSVDVIISNCVINLTNDKEKVFSEIFRVLKPGGELYFSDVFCDRRIPKELMDDPLLLGECLSGAMYIEDFRRMLSNLNINDYRVVTESPFEVNDVDIRKKLGMVKFTSMTLRTFKCDFEDICENYGHVAYYQGGIHEYPNNFILDDHHQFEKGFPIPVCGNTSKMISETRFGEHFLLVGDFSSHYGEFPCELISNGKHDIPSSGSCC
jgi:arsenite methyltransferase